MPEMTEEKQVEEVKDAETVDNSDISEKIEEVKDVEEVKEPEAVQGEEVADFKDKMAEMEAKIAEISAKLDAANSEIDSKNKELAAKEDEIKAQKIDEVIKMAVADGKMTPGQAAEGSPFVELAHKDVELFKKVIDSLNGAKLPTESKLSNDGEEVLEDVEDKIKVKFKELVDGGMDPVFAMREARKNA